MFQETEQRPFFTLAVSTPEEERWYVLSVYRLAVNALISRRRRSTDGEVLAFLVELKQKDYAWQIFTHNALKLRAKEFQRQFSECQLEIKDPREAEQITKRIFKEKYRQIDNDPGQNHSFLDNLLLAKNI